MSEKVKPKCVDCEHYYTVAEQLHYEVPYCEFGYVGCISQDYRFFKGADE